MEKSSEGSRELQCVGKMEIARPKSVGFLCGSIPVPTDKSFHFNSALIPSRQTFVLSLSLSSFILYFIVWFEFWELKLYFLVFWVLIFVGFLWFSEWVLLGIGCFRRRRISIALRSFRISLKRFFQLVLFSPRPPEVRFMQKKVVWFAVWFWSLL